MMTTYSLVPRSAARRAVPSLLGSLSEFDRLFADAWQGFERSPAFAPRVDVRETADVLVLAAELPGLEEKDFHLSVEGGVVTLSGEKRSERDAEGERYRLVERSSGSFSRAFRVPFEFDPEAVTARFTNGVLEVTIPKPESSPARVRTIPVSQD